MNSQDFLILNALAGAAFLFWYFVSRGGPKKPTQLNMKAEDSAPPLFKPNVSHPHEGLSEVKSLNVVFNYNGHAWDAYEVLGVPAGSNIKVVTDAYQRSIRRCEKESIEFFEAAYKAILHSKK